METPPTIVYLGTSDFAVPTLMALDRSRFDLKLVITQPDRPKGRGRRLAPSPVKNVALQKGYTIVQPGSVREEDFISMLKAVGPDFLVVAAFGQILPSRLLKIPKYGAINVHGSLLPRYRGPAPVQWAIMRGETKTGVSTILMDHGVDTGDLFLSDATPISDEDTAATLHDRLAGMGAALLVKTIDGIIDGSVLPRAQNHKHATYAPMLTKENGRIQWRHSARMIDARIRALTPWPGAFCSLRGRRYKIHKAVPILSLQGSRAGTVIPGFPDELRVATGDGALAIIEIQEASGKRMPIRSYLHGHPISPGEIFE